MSTFKRKAALGGLALMMTAAFGAKFRRKELLPPGQKRRCIC
ncbi:hypothetical protein [Paenibacillus sp. MBLB4367]